MGSKLRGGDLYSRRNLINEIYPKHWL